MFSTTHTVTTLSHHNQIITSTTTLLKHLKSLLPPTIIIFCCFTLNSTRNNFHWLTNYSHYIINSRLIWLHAFHFTHLNQPLKIQRYCTTLISLLNTHEKKLHTRVVHRRPNIRSHSVLFYLLRFLGSVFLSLRTNQDDFYAPVCLFFASYRAKTNSYV